MLSKKKYFLWGYVKERVYAINVNDVTELRDRIKQELASITLDMIHSIYSEISYRLDIFRATRGAHVEVY
jgi:penicillin-binding protein-related factor A (putative recombinase)